MLICKNVIVNGRRTSMRLDKETWLSLSEICKTENTNLHALCSKIEKSKGECGLSGAVRSFVLTYLRTQLAQYRQQLENLNRDI